MVKELPELLYDVKVDLTNWPLLVLTTPEVVTDDKLEGFLQSYGDYVREKKEKFAVVVNVSDTEGMTPGQRRIMNASINDPSTSEYLICVGMVFKSKVLSRVLTAILWIKKSDYPVKVFSSVEEAKDWAKSKL
jgi:hypothetical protein